MKILLKKNPQIVLLKKEAETIHIIQLTDEATIRKVH